MIKKTWGGKILKSFKDVRQNSPRRSHSQQVVWNFFPHHRLDADVPPCGIKRIAYINADQRAEFLALTSSSSCFSGDVHH